MSEFCERTIGWIEAVLGAAPKGQVLPTLSLEPAEDRLARAAFGRKPKLAPHQAREVRERLASGETQRSIARSYNVSQATISRLAT